MPGRALCFVNINPLVDSLDYLYFIIQHSPAVLHMAESWHC